MIDADCAHLPSLEWRTALDPGHVLVLGEVHGTDASPQFAAWAACAALDAGGPVSVGFEWPSTLGASSIEALAASEFFTSGSQDGRKSTAMLELYAAILRWRDQGAEIEAVFLDPDDDHRDAGMASVSSRWMAAHPNGVHIALVGNAHARLADGIDPQSPPYAWHLVDRGLNVLSLDATYAGGAAWNCRAREGCGPHDLAAPTVTAPSPGISWDNASPRFSGRYLAGRAEASPPAAVPFDWTAASPALWGRAGAAWLVTGSIEAGDRVVLLLEDPSAPSGLHAIVPSREPNRWDPDHPAAVHPIAPTRFEGRSLVAVGGQPRPEGLLIDLLTPSGERRTCVVHDWAVTAETWRCARPSSAANGRRAWDQRALAGNYRASEVTLGRALGRTHSGRYLRLSPAGSGDEPALVLQIADAVSGPWSAPRTVWQGTTGHIVSPVIHGWWPGSDTLVTFGVASDDGPPTTHVLRIPAALTDP